MQIHIVGGFLGSGKTTAIHSACQLLRENDIAVGVITNDQGEKLVDSQVFSASGFSVREVTSGCFCCNYHNLVREIRKLKECGVEHIFAEAVGSCVDISTTVINPLLRRDDVDFENLTFSVLCDSTLLENYISERPFSWSNPALSYLFSRQLAECPTLVINKIDLIEGNQKKFIRKINDKFPDQTLITQDSRMATGVKNWLHTLTHTTGNKTPLPGVEIDYDIYGTAEAALSWNDREIQFTGTNNCAIDVVRDLLSYIMDKINQLNIIAGHIKFFIRSHSYDAKISMTANDLAETNKNSSWKSTIPPLDGDQVSIIINARLEIDAMIMDRLIDSAINLTIKSRPKIELNMSHHASFHPSYPKPIYRFKK